MSDFRKLSGNVWASPQITVADIAEAAKLGVTLVVNNRPENESEDQTPGAEIEAAARAAGMDYRAIPVTMQSLSQKDVVVISGAQRARPGLKVAPRQGRIVQEKAPPVSQNNEAAAASIALPAGEQ